MPNRFGNSRRRRREQQQQQQQPAQPPRQPVAPERARIDAGLGSTADTNAARAARKQAEAGRPARSHREQNAKLEQAARAKGGTIYREAGQRRDETPGEFQQRSRRNSQQRRDAGQGKRDAMDFKKASRISGIDSERLMDAGFEPGKFTSRQALQLQREARILGTTPEKLLESRHRQQQRQAGQAGGKQVGQPSPDADVGGPPKKLSEVDERDRKDGQVYQQDDGSFVRYDEQVGRMQPVEFDPETREFGLGDETGVEREVGRERHKATLRERGRRDELTNQLESAREAHEDGFLNDEQFEHAQRQIQGKLRGLEDFADFEEEEEPEHPEGQAPGQVWEHANGAVMTRDQDGDVRQLAPPPKPEESLTSPPSAEDIAKWQAEAIKNLTTINLNDGETVRPTSGEVKEYIREQIALRHWAAEMNDEFANPSEPEPDEEPLPVGGPSFGGAKADSLRDRSKTDDGGGDGSKEGEDELEPDPLGIL